MVPLVDFATDAVATRRAVECARAVVLVLTSGSLSCPQQLGVIRTLSCGLAAPPASENVMSGLARRVFADSAAAGPEPVLLCCPGFEFPQDSFYSGEKFQNFFNASDAE